MIRRYDPRPQQCERGRPPAISPTAAFKAFCPGGLSTACGSDNNNTEKKERLVCGQASQIYAIKQFTRRYMPHLGI